MVYRPCLRASDEINASLAAALNVLKELKVNIKQTNDCTVKNATKIYHEGKPVFLLIIYLPPQHDLKDEKTHQNIRTRNMPASN